MKYAELHARSAFSFLEGASLPEALVFACGRNEVPAMALLDRNGFYGSPRFHISAQQNKIKAHIGAELSVADAPRDDAPSYPLLREMMPRVIRCYAHRKLAIKTCAASLRKPNSALRRTLPLRQRLRS